MPTPDTLAAQLARCVERFRDVSLREEQKLAFRALMTLLQAEPLTLRDDGGQVSVNGSPVDGSAMASLAQRLAFLRACFNANHLVDRIADKTEERESDQRDHDHDKHCLNGAAEHEGEHDVQTFN